MVRVYRSIQDWEADQMTKDRGPQHLIVGFVCGLALGLLLPFAF
jgi:hypothetical protein